LTDEQKKWKHANIGLAERLGAEIVTLSGGDIATVIAEYARLSGITNIVVGKSRHKRWPAADLDDQLLALLPQVESTSFRATPTLRPQAGLHGGEIWACIFPGEAPASRCCCSRQPRASPMCCDS